MFLKWTENCVLTEIAEREEKAATQDPAQDRVPPVNVLSNLKFSITECKLYVQVVTLQTKYQNLLYKHLKTGISIDFTWNKYRSQIIN